MDVTLRSTVGQAAEVPRKRTASDIRRNIDVTAEGQGAERGLPDGISHVDGEADGNTQREPTDEAQVGAVEAIERAGSAAIIPKNDTGAKSGDAWYRGEVTSPA